MLIQHTCVPIKDSNVIMYSNYSFKALNSQDVQHKDGQRNGDELHASRRDAWHDSDDLNIGKLGESFKDTE